MIYILTAIATSAAITSVSEVKELIKSDTCMLDKYSVIQPRVKKVVSNFVENQSQLNKIQLLAVFNQLKIIVNKCNMEEKIVKTVQGDPVKFAGIALLLASNCFKDAGAVLLILDSIFLDPSNVTNDIIVAIFVGIFGMQGYKDCSALINYIR